jgi:hypothetical protein
MHRYPSEPPAKLSSFEMDLRLVRNNLLESVPSVYGSTLSRFELFLGQEVGIQM